jgi:hypothetical protein
MSVAFVICTERHFEAKSLLLVRSMRRFGGKLGAASPVFSYSPRPTAVPSESLLREFAALDVHSILDVPNSLCPEYDFANKVVACAHAERNITEGTIVFLDSDQIVLREPTALALSQSVEVAARPVDRKFIGIATDDDANYPYWKKLYEIAGSLPKRRVYTTLDNEPIWEYYNSGLIAARREAGIFSHWERVFNQILDSGVLPTTGIGYVEQSALSASITAKASRVNVLPRGYNFPVIPEWGEGWKNYKPEIANATTLHYHRSFDGGRWREWLFPPRGRWREWFSPGKGLPLHQKKLAWLNVNLAELGI